MMQILPESILSALEVADTVSGMECPQCGGGETKERSFSATRRGNVIAFRCWRNSCGYKGRGSTGESVPDYSESFTPRTYVGLTWDLSEQEADNLAMRYGLFRWVLQKAGVKSTGDGTALYMPVQSPDSAPRGAVVRTTVGPKRIKTYKTVPGVFQAWYVGSGPVIIVEDQLSAMRLRQEGRTAVALLGTDLSGEKLDEIASYTRSKGYAYAVLALDNDAYQKALSYAKRYAGVLPLVPVLLQKDIKDMTDEAITELLEGLDQ